MPLWRRPLQSIDLVYSALEDAELSLRALQLAPTLAPFVRESIAALYAAAEPIMATIDAGQFFDHKTLYAAAGNICQSLIAQLANATLAAGQEQEREQAVSSIALIDPLNIRRYIYAHTTHHPATAKPTPAPKQRRTSYVHQWDARAAQQRRDLETYADGWDGHTRAMGNPQA